MAFKRVGFGQVEPNHLSAQRTSQIYAQLPAKSDIAVLENGQFVKYDYKAKENAIGEVNLTGAGEWMLVYNEVKTYDARETAADYVMNSASFGNPVPRVFKTNVGDIMTTNAINLEEDYVIKVADTLIVGNDGFLKIGTHEKDMVWQVAKVYTLADGQPAVKIVRIQ